MCTSDVNTGGKQRTGLGDELGHVQRLERVEDKLLADGACHQQEVTQGTGDVTQEKRREDAVNKRHYP